MMTRQLLFGLLIATAAGCREELREVLADETPGERWIWDDYARATAIAKERNKPLLVVFRCVP